MISKIAMLLVTVCLIACGDGGLPGPGGEVAVRLDAGAVDVVPVSVDAGVIPTPADAGRPDGLVCAQFECKFSCDDGGTTYGSANGPWKGCYCLGYECTRWATKGCSVNDYGCVVLPPGVLDAGLP